MRWIRRRAEEAAVLGALALLASGPACSGSLASPIAAAHPDDATPRRGGTLHLATLFDGRSLDPAGPSDGFSRLAMEAMYAGLVDYDTSGTLVPELAERWDIADDGRTYRFTLRQGARFQDGDEVTADDLKRSAERALAADAPEPFREYFSSLVGLEEFVAGKAKQLDGVTVEGRYVVSYRLKERDATFLAKLALHVLRPVCKSAGERYSDTWQPCGAGPFKAPPGALQPGFGLRLVRHDAYFRPGQPYLDAVEWAFQSASFTQRLRFESGSLDVARELTQADVMRFMTDPRWKAFGTYEPDTVINAEVMNVNTPPFDNVEIRRAVAAAIDREHYRLVNQARVSVAAQMIPTAVPGSDPTFVGQQHDLAAALEHMRRAGYSYDPATGRGGWPGTVVYYAYAPGLTEYTSQLLQQDLAKIGIRLEIRMVSGSTWATLAQRPTQQGMIGFNNVEDYPDAMSFLEAFTSDQTSAEISQTGSAYKNPAYDGIIARARRELDADARKALYHEANAILCSDAPWAVTNFYHQYVMHQPYVRGYVPHPVWLQDVRQVWLDRDGGEGKLAALLGRPR
jgi:ABC-type transport system substrate-binding protein